MVIRQVRDIKVVMGGDGPTRCELGKAKRPRPGVQAQGGEGRAKGHHPAASRARRGPMADSRAHLGDGAGRPAGVTRTTGVAGAV